jgi:hypothetical protein
MGGLVPPAAPGCVHSLRWSGCAWQLLSRAGDWASFVGLSGGSEAGIGGKECGMACLACRGTPRMLLLFAWFTLPPATRAAKWWELVGGGKHELRYPA